MSITTVRLTKKNSKLRLSEPPQMIYGCDCTNCQRISGSAFGLAANINEGTFEFMMGQPATVTWSSEAGNERYGHFCGDCGCRIAPGQTPSIGLQTLRAGTFDDASWVVPAGHSSTRSAQPWFVFGNDNILREEQPTDYGPLIKKFQMSDRRRRQMLAFPVKPKARRSPI